MMAEYLPPATVLRQVKYQNCLIQPRHGLVCQRVHVFNNIHVFNNSFNFSLKYFGEQWVVIGLLY